MKKGDYRVTFDWQSDQPNGELEVFFNHQLVGSFKSKDESARSDVVHIKACECCEGKNLLKFVVTGEVTIGLDNIHV